MSGRLKGIFAIVVSAFGFALMAACVRLCDDYGAKISCFEKSFFRNLIALIIASMAIWRVAHSEGFGPIFKITRHGAGVLTLRCLLGSIGIFANFYALSKIPIACGQTLNKTAPFFTVIFASMFLGERMKWRQLVALTVAFAGAMLVVKPGFAGADSFALLMGLLGGLCAGGAYAAVRAMGAHRVSSALIVFVFSAFSCFISIPLSLINFTPLTFAQFVILVGAGAGAAIGQFGITLAYRLAAPREIAVFDYTNIIFTGLFGFMLFGQIPDGYSILGMVIIVMAAILINLKNSK